MAETTATTRTMGDIEKRYNDRREQILHSGLSASMSGIEYYPKPWSEMDILDEADRYSIINALTWNGEAHDLKLPFRDSEVKA
jgi:hypothetical protein